jgi:hypothetical protein
MAARAEFLLPSGLRLHGGRRALFRKAPKRRQPDGAHPASEPLQPDPRIRPRAQGRDRPQHPKRAHLRRSVADAARRLPGAARLEERRQRRRRHHPRARLLLVQRVGHARRRGAGERRSRDHLGRGEHHRLGHDRHGVRDEMQHRRLCGGRRRRRGDVEDRLREDPHPLLGHAGPPFHPDRRARQGRRARRAERPGPPGLHSPGPAGRSDPPQPPERARQAGRRGQARPPARLHAPACSPL